MFSLEQGSGFQNEVASPLGEDLYIRLPETIPNSGLATLAPPSLAAPAIPPTHGGPAGLLALPIRPQALATRT